MSVTPFGETTYRDLVSVEVVDRQVFYNGSIFDGGQAGINSLDDAAIAGDKTALLPGGTASFANYTSYGRGLNGLMVDIAGLPTATLSAGDFEFRVGNTNDPAAWATAPAPVSIGVRTGAGISGSARVEIVWAEGAIQKQWLQVTVKATNNTGLTIPDVFYFGNTVGETGNSAGDTLVDGTDHANTVANFANPAPIASVYDFNRDGVVDLTDATIAADNSTNVATALKLIVAPQVVQQPEQQRLQTSLFTWGSEGYEVFNIPAIVTTVSGTVLAFVEGRGTGQDASSYAIVMRRSTDGGATWSVPTAVYQIPSHGEHAITNPTPVVDKITGEVHLLFCEGTVNSQSGLLEVSEVLVTKSTDDGLTWTTPVNITSSVKVTQGNNPGPPGVFPDTPWGWNVVGPGHGIQLEHGAYAGRLLVGADHRETADVSGKSWSHVIYSDDHGETWKLGGGLVGLSDPKVVVSNDYSNENSLVELPNGNLYMSIRVQRKQQHFRGEAVSIDGGITWSNMQPANELKVYQVQGTVLQLNDNVLLFASPYSRDWTDEVRHEMSIWISYDAGASWTNRKVISFGYAGYSDMTIVGPDTILLSYSRGWTGGIGLADGSNNSPEFNAEIGLARINLRWLESADPYEFNWYFNEQAPGEHANHSGSSIQDYGPWDQRAWARATSAAVAAQYVAGANGDSALLLTNQPGANGVILSQAYNGALYAEPNDSFTVQIMLKTTDDTGVIIGTRPSVRNWTLQIVEGKVRFSLFDTVNLAAITSEAVINDGQWHHIAAVRDAQGRLLKLYIDHIEAAAPVVDTATKPRDQFEHVPIDPMYLGGDNTLSAASKLDVTVDTLRFTRAVVSPDKFFGADLVEPIPPPAPTYLPNAPTSLPGLRFWLPPYDPTRNFSDFGSFANPLPYVPFVGMATRSLIESSGNDYHLQTSQPYRQVLYNHDSVIGPYWDHVVDEGGSELMVQNPALGSAPNQFDFVQNTGVFTLSTFVKVGTETGGYMTIFDTNEGSAAKAGFSLFVLGGTLYFTVSGGTAQTVRFDGTGPVALAGGQWYHVAVVGNGPGNPLKFYITPAGAMNVAAFESAAALTGADGTYATDLRHLLFIGGRSNSLQPGAAPFNGGLVNEAIFDQALTPAQVQQLFLFGKGLTSTVPPWQNPVNPLDVNNNGKVQASDALAIISRLLMNLGSELPAPSPGFSPPPYFDVTGNNTFNAQDALQVISWLLAHPPGSEPQVSPATAALGDEPNAADQPGAGEMAPQVAALQSTEELAIAPQVALVREAGPESLPIRVSSMERADLTETSSAAVRSAAPLLLEPRLPTTAAPRKSAGSAPVAGGDDVASLAADEYFRVLARIDEDGGTGAAIVNGPHALRWPLRRAPATA